MSSSEGRVSGNERVLWGVLLSGLLYWLFLLTSPEPNRRRGPTPCKKNLHQIAIALHNYHDTYHCFPPAYVADASGRPMHSWRVLILPFLDKDELYTQYRFDEPWDGPNNRRLTDQTKSVFHCPSDKSGAPTDTSYVVVVGPSTVFPGTECTRFDDITDGQVNTILVVEMANSGIHWMEPRDLAFEDAIKGVNPKEGPGISSGHEGGAQIAKGDATVKFISNQTPKETLRWLLERNDGHVVPDY